MAAAEGEYGAGRVVPLLMEHSVQAGCREIRGVTAYYHQPGGQCYIQDQSRKFSLRCRKSRGQKTSILWCSSGMVEMPMSELKGSSCPW